MNRKLLLPIVLAASIIFLSGSVAAATVTIEPSQDKNLDTGSPLTVEGEVTGEDLDEIRLYESDTENGFYSLEKTENCLGTSCDVQKFFSYSSEKTSYYKVEADWSDSSEEKGPVKVSWKDDGSGDEGDEITSLTMSPSSTKSVDSGSSVEVSGEVQGDDLEEIRIYESDTENGFYSLEKTENCLGNTCSLEKFFNYAGDETRYYKIEAESGSETREEGPVRVNWKEDEEVDKIDSVSISPKDRTVEEGTSVTIEGAADGRELESIRLYEQEDQSGSYVLEKSQSCSYSSCDISKFFNYNTDKTSNFKIKAISEDEERTAGPITVEWEETENTKPHIDLRQPYDGEYGVSRNPVYRFKITDEDDSEMEDTTLYLEEKDFSGDEPWNVPDYKYNIHADVGDVDSYSSTTTWLDPDQEYVWGIKADDGDTEVRSEVYSFTTQGRDDDGDDDDDEDGSLEVTVRDGDYDRLENANVRIKNGDYRTGSTDYRGEAEFANLHPDWYDVRVRCDGETETNTIYVSEDEEETLTVRMDQDSGDDYCNDDDGDDDDGEEEDRPEASFTISDTNPEIGESVKFDASGSDGDIMEYRWAFPDGTSKYGTSVYKSFDSAGEKDIQLRVTEYDYDQDRTSRTITVQRRDDDDDEDEGEDPTARLDIDPSDAEIGEEIEFDATDSYDDGEIEEYEFDLDGDGDWDVENDDGEVERAFFDEFDGEARVRVTDDDGNRDVTDEDYELRSRSRVSISTIDIPERVCDGESFEATFDVENLGDRERFVVLEARGFGDTRSRTIELDEDETREVSITLTAGDAGSRTVRVSAQNSNTVRNTVDVLECDDGSEGEVSGISVSVMPDRVKAGESVQVSGYVENTRGRKNIRILMNGRLVADTQTQPDGYYQVYAYPEEIGGNSIVASSGGETARTSIQVLPTVSVSTVETPENIFQGETFEICGRVESQVSPLVVLMRNGERIDSKYGEGEVCFDTVSNTAGDTEYSIQAFARGESGSQSREVEVLETKPETSSFPGQIASVESGDGIVKATVYNNHDEQRRYDLELSGLPSTWVSTSEKQVILQPGEEREVFFYLTPREEGERTADVRIESQGSKIYDESVDVWTGGTKENQGRSITWRLRNAFSWW